MSGSKHSSVRIFSGVSAGNSSAADMLFHRYVDRLSRFARARLGPRLARRVDPEDIVMSAYRSFFVSAQAGQFRIDAPGDLWALLTTITLRKIYRSAAHHAAEKRNINKEEHDNGDFDLAKWVMTREPSPAEAVSLSDELEAIFNGLPPNHRQVLELRLQGESVRDIASETNTSERTVRRVLSGIRENLGRKYGVSVSKNPDLTCETHVADGARSQVKIALPPESLISFDQLLLLRLIGSGGMGKVYEAIDRQREIKVAVKFLHRSFQREQRAVARFLEEANIVRQIRHSGIVGIHGTGRTAAGVYFIVMDLVEGPGLAECSLPMPWSEAVSLTTAVANAIAHAHASDVIHCDLKPANILLAAGRKPVVVDFGLAQRPEFAARPMRAVAGTAPWMAPEQVDSSFGPVTIRTDVYGLGALLYTLLTGSPPFSGKRTSEILSRLISAAKPQPPSDMVDGIPPAVEQICLQCLSKQSADRPGSAAELAELLLRG